MSWDVGLWTPREPNGQKKDVKHLLANPEFDNSKS